MLVKSLALERASGFAFSYHKTKNSTSLENLSNRVVSEICSPLMLCAIICVMAMPLKDATNASLFIVLLFFMLLLFLFVAK